MGKKISVIGSGSWATAITKLLTENGHQVQWWLRTQEQVDSLLATGTNTKYLSDIHFNLSNLKPSADINLVLADTEFVFLVVPSAFLQTALSGTAYGALQGKTIVSGIKGIIPEGNQLITDYLESTFGLSHDSMTILAGPCHAEEVALEKIIAIVQGMGHTTGNGHHIFEDSGKL